MPYMTNPPCPYCGSILKKVPKRPAMCPDCGKRIYPHDGLPFYNTDLLTEEQELVRSTYGSLSNTYGLGVTFDMYETTRQELSAKFKTQARWSDVTWSIYAQLVDRYARVPDFDKLSMLYAGMASFLWQSHKDATHFKRLIQESARYRLMLFQGYGFKTARVYVYAYNCEACKRLEGTTIDVAKALKDIPLAPGYCVCNLAGNAS